MPHSQKVRRKDMDFLSGEISSWTENGIISDSQASEILSLYDVKSGSLRVVMLIAGGILLALGALSFLLAHWHQIDKTIRVIVIAGAYLASLAAYFFTGRSSTKTGKSFLLLSSLIFGGGIYLITHMYDIPITLGEFLGYWSAQVIATSAISRDEWTMYLACVLSSLWLHEIDAINALALYFVRTARVPVSEFFTPVYAFVLLAALWGAWMAVRDRVAFMMCVMITVMLFATRMSLCFGGTWSLIIIACAGAVMSFIGRWPDTETMGLIMLGGAGILLTWPEFWRGEIFASHRALLAVVNAVIVAGIMLVNIWRGHSAVGVIFCALLASRYFFDHFFGYLPKAWGFTLTGVIFVVAGLFFGRIRKFLGREES